MEVLCEVLKARHGDRPAGHWVTMEADIGGVKVIAICYAWSQKGCSYFCSSCGSTCPHPLKYESKYEDSWGIPRAHMIDRPSICHFLYTYLPHIDEHNKQRQTYLMLEKRWLTKDPWFRLMTSIVGMSVVDMHRVYRHHEIRLRGIDPEEVDEVRVRKFTDLICGGLKKWPQKERGTLNRNSISSLEEIKANLKRMGTQEDPTQKTINVNAKQESQGRRTGNLARVNCFICRQYVADRTKASRNVNNPTPWVCIHCGMPLCLVDRSRDKNRVGCLHCVEEHLTTEDPFFACTPNNPYPRKGRQVPSVKYMDCNPYT